MVSTGKIRVINNILATICLHFTRSHYYRHSRITLTGYRQTLADITAILMPAGRSIPRHCPDYFKTMRTHIIRTRHKDPLYSICVLTHAETYI